MRMSASFSQTLREMPADTDAVSHQLLLRAGYIRQLGSGIFSYLPLAQRVIHKIEQIMREEIDAIGGQEISMPVVHPADIWKETGRWQQIGSEMGRFHDKSGHDMVLAMTHEEVVADLVRKGIRSYRQLPALIYHLQTKWRDDPRPRAGLIRVREFTMLDSYSLDADWSGLDRQYRSHFQAYYNIYHRCGLPALAVKADVGMMGGKLAHEFMYLTPIGEDTLILCDHCGYTANRQVASFTRSPAGAEQPLPMQKIATPDVKTIDQLAAFLNIASARTAKAVFMTAQMPAGGKTVDRVIFAVVRGDLNINETKLANVVKAREMRPATEAEIRAIGAVPGYGSPVGVTDAVVVVDDSVAHSPKLVAGANEEGYHLLNVNYGRDYNADAVADIAVAEEGAACPACQSPLRAARGVEIGNIFQLGTRYSDAMGCVYQDSNGSSRPVVMGSYGIGVGRLLACIVEEHHDEMGIAWPITVAPYQVVLLLLNGEPRTAQAAEQLYRDLSNAGIEVLFDDRTERPGVKFMDADLIGVPVRLTIGDRSLRRGGIEMKRRTSQESRLIPLDGVISHLVAEIRSLQAEIAVKVTTMEYQP